MTCNACGEKPKDTAKDFTKAVIEINNPETLVLLRKVVIPASMGTEEDVPAAIGKYHNVILHYEANKHTYLYSSDGIPTLIEIPQELLDRISNLEEGLEQEITAREGMDEELQSNIDAVAQDLEDFKNSPDVVDIVPTYADLQNYDTSELGDKDIVRVLADETHEGESSYYRWSTDTSTWTFIGATGPYYTKSETDNLLDEKQNALTAGENITIANDTISASGGAAVFYIDYLGLMNLPLNTSTSIAIYKDKEMTTLATQAEMYNALYSDKVVKLATIDPNDPTSLSWEAFTVIGNIDNNYDGELIGFDIYSSIWDEGLGDDKVIFTWNRSNQMPTASKHERSPIKTIEVRGGTLDITQLHEYETGRITKITNRGGGDTLLLPKGIEGNSNYQLRIKQYESVILITMMQGAGVSSKYLLLGASDGSDVQIAFIEPNASSKLELWTQPVDNLTTSSFDGRKVLSARQGKVLADRIGDLSTLQTTAKTSTVAAINELVGSGGGIATINSTDWSALWQ